MAQKTSPLFLSLIHMTVKKITAIILILILTVAGIAIFIGPDRVSLHNDAQPDSIAEHSNYTDKIEFTNENLPLSSEVVQFKIQFMWNDTVHSLIQVFASYIDRTTVGVVVFLTDGQKLLSYCPAVYVPERKFELVTPRLHLSLGKLWLVNLFNRYSTDKQVGTTSKNTSEFRVHGGDTWYLTIAVLTSSERGCYYGIQLKSKTKSMEITELQRHSRLGLRVASNNQWNGKYYGLKLGVLGGFSAFNVDTEVVTHDGSFIDLKVLGHRKALVEVSYPNGTVISSDQDRGISFMFMGNQSGRWKFSARGYSLYFREGIVLIYADVDLHVKVKP